MKRLIFAAMLLLSVCQLRAQDGVEFMHSLGGKFFLYPNTEDGLTGTTILYSPRVNLTSTENTSISVGTHLGLGFAMYSGPEGSSSSLILDAPLVGEFNFGHGSTSESEAGFGGYIGAGYGFHRVSMNVDGYSSSATLNGPVFTGGIRFAMGSIGSYDIGFSYMANIKKDIKVNPIGISISIMLGMDN
jgi:hypothetical protein